MSLGLSGVGGILFLKKDHKICFRTTLGVGTNNWTKLNALRLLMRLAIEKGVDQIQIMGDSKLVAYWINNKNNMHNMSLSLIMERIKELKRNFSKISSHHLYRANELS